MRLVLLASWSKSRQKVKNCQKVQKTSKVWKNCKDHRFGGMFTKTPIFRQLHKKNSSFRQSSDSFLSSFYWAQEPLSRPLLLQLLTRQGKVNRAAHALSRFSLVEGKSLSREHSSSLPDITNGPFAPKFIRKMPVLFLLLQFWRCAPEENVQAKDQGRDIWWLGAYRENSQGLFYVTKIIRTELTTEKTREIIIRKDYGDLQLLPIPTHYRKDTSYDLILIIVDWLTKMVHYKPVQITIDAPGLVKVFIDLVARHNNLSNLIVSDKDSFFTSKFWCLRYHFQARLQLHAFELNCGCRPHISYEEDISPRSRFNKESHDYM